MGRGKRSSSSSSSSRSSESKDKKKIEKKKQKHHKKQKTKKDKDFSQNNEAQNLNSKPELTAEEKIEKILERIKESNPVEPENPFKNKPPLDLKKKKEPPKFEPMNSAAPKMIEVIVNDRLGKKVRVKCCPDDTIGDLKKLIALQTGTKAEKIRLQKWYNIYKDHITLQDYEIHDGMGLEMYYH